MKIEALHGCCSTSHLYSVLASDILSTNPRDFREWVLDRTGVKVLIYLTNFTFWRNPKVYMKLWSLGFRCIASYPGSTGRKVNIMIYRTGR